MNSVFITATGTEIGKTHYACSLLRKWKRAGQMPHPIKPLMSGFSSDDLASSDAGRLLKAAGLEVTSANVSRMCLHCFEEAVAPNQAARHLGRKLDYNDILAFVNSRVLLAGTDPVLVEGAGGIMSPVTDKYLHTHLISDLAMPAILVTANYLGSISHTLSAIEIMHRRSIPIEKVVVTRPNESYGEPQALMDELVRWCDVSLEAMNDE